MPSALIWIVAVAALSVLLALLLVGLRFVRRGRARFHLALPFLCVVLLPTSLGATLSARTLRETLRDMALTGGGGVAACSAGAAEAQMALVAGLVSSSLLGLLALLLVVAGTSRTPAADERARVPVVSLLLTLMAAGVVTVLAAAGIAASILLVTHDVTLGEYSVPTIQLVLALLVLCVLPLLVLHGLLQAPRERPRPLTLVLAIALPLVGVGVTATLAASAYYTMHCLSRVATTGSAAECPLTSGLAPSAPEPAVGTEWPSGTGGEPEPTLTPPPPPPPPPPPEETGGAVVGGVAPAPSVPPPASLTKRFLRVGGEIQEPKKLKHVSPVYPPLARQARVQGVVVLEATLAASGRVRDVRVLRGHPLLEAAAIDAVRQWIYAPTLLDGEPVPVIMTVTVNFQID